MQTIFIPVPRRNGPNRVLRGGSWINSAQNCRMTNRNNDDPENRNNNYGFRLVLAPARARSQQGSVPEQPAAPVPFAQTDKKRYSYRPVVPVLVGRHFRRLRYPFFVYTHYHV